MSPAEFADAMRKVIADFGGDPDIAHGAADEQLCQTLEQLGYDEGVAVWREAAEGWWWA